MIVSALEKDVGIPANVKTAKILMNDVYFYRLSTIINKHKNPIKLIWFINFTKLSNLIWKA